MCSFLNTPKCLCEIDCGMGSTVLQPVVKNMALVSNAAMTLFAFS